MEDTTVLSLLDKLFTNESLRKKFLEAIRQPPEPQQNVEPEDTESGSARDNETDPPSGNNNEQLGSQVVADEHQPEHSSLGTDVSHQSRGVSGLVADEHQSTVNPLVTRVHHGAASEDPSQEKPQMFDPSSLSTSDNFTFETHEVITQYLETHFCLSLNKDVQSAMHKAHPVPRTPVMKVPKVDRYILDHLRQNFPKSRDSELGTIQSALISATGPLTCLWAELLDNNLLEDPDSLINVQDVLNVIQRTLVLLGNATELVSQTRRCNILQCVDKSLVKYGKDSASKNQESLFGPDFCSQLKNQVESVKTFSQVVSLAHRYHPYEKSRETTLGRSKKHFFRQGLVGKFGSRQGHTYSPKKQLQNLAPHQKNSIRLEKLAKS